VTESRLSNGNERRICRHPPVKLPRPAKQLSTVIVRLNSSWTPRFDTRARNGAPSPGHPANVHPRSEADGLADRRAGP
jgi:hypothetical protein